MNYNTMTSGREVYKNRKKCLISDVYTGVVGARISTGIHTLQQLCLAGFTAPQSECAKWNHLNTGNGIRIGPIIDMLGYSDAPS